MKFLFSIPTSGGWLALYVLGAAIVLLFLCMIGMFFSGSKKRKKQAAQQKKKPVEKKEKPAEPVVVKEEPKPEPIPEPVVQVVEEPKPEPVVQPVVEEEPEAEEEPVSEDEPESDSDEEIDEADNSIVVLGERRILVQYNRSFQSRMIQSDEVVQGYYGELKNNLLSYEKVKSRISWTNDSFRCGRATIAKFGMRGKLLSIYLAIDPATLEDTNTSFEDVSEIKKYEQTPTRLKLKSERAVKKAIEFIERMMNNLGIEMGREQNKDYSMPYETSEALIYRMLIKLNARDENGEAVTDLSFEEIINAPSEKYRLRTGKKIRKSVTVDTAQALMTDELANTFIQTVEEGAAAKTSGKKEVINVDTLSDNFAAGDTVDLVTLKEKGLIAKDIGHVTVAARGTINKPLTVKVQEFSPDAVKMIVTVGGEVFRA